MKQKQLLAIGAILLATLFWGMTFAFIKKAVTSLSPSNFLFWRFGIASLLLFLFTFKTLRTESKAGTYRAGFFLGLFLLGTVLFQTIGLQTTSASTASFITGIAVILVPLFSSFINKTLPKLKVIIAAIIAFAGIALISLRSGYAISAGELWVLLCAICFALFIFLSGKYARGHHAVGLTMAQCTTIFLISGILGCITHTLTIPTTLEAWVSILFCAVFASIFAFLLQLHYQKYISSTTTAIIFSCEPIFATLTAVILLSEQPTSRFYIGAVLIFMAIIISEFSLKKSTMPQE
jgi:drug/metabolite transporter (DMT)-like permease